MEVILWNQRIMYDCHFEIHEWMQIAWIGLTVIDARRWMIWNVDGCLTVMSALMSVMVFDVDCWLRPSRWCGDYIKWQGLFVSRKCYHASARLVCCRYGFPYKSASWIHDARSWIMRKSNTVSWLNYIFWMFLWVRLKQYRLLKIPGPSHNHRESSQEPHARPWVALPHLGTVVPPFHAGPPQARFSMPDKNVSCKHEIVYICHMSTF